MATPEQRSSALDETLAPESSDGRESARRGEDGLPARLGRYRLLHQLGRGGMGIVHAAHDETLDRLVALKLLLADGNPEDQQRLVREARALARLSHPNVVQVYEIVESELRTYMVMEYIDGATLRGWLRASKRSRGAILEVFDAAGRGLAAAHAAGLVHRDFKPDNVMIRAHDGRVVVVDFGLARAQQLATDPLDPSPATIDGSSPINLDATTSSNTTAPGALLGTPHYMAPEQFRGELADAKSDQFAFCVALWEALYRERPFQGSNLMALLSAVTEARLSEPSHNEVPPWIRRVLERGLALEPAKRWPTMPALLAALRSDPTRRRRWVLAGVCASVLAIGTGVSVELDRTRARAEASESCELEAQAIASEWNATVEGELEAAFEASSLAFASSTWASSRPRMAAYADEWTDLRREACLATRVEQTRDAAAYRDLSECLDEAHASFATVVEAWRGATTPMIIAAPQAVAGLPQLSHCIDGSWQASRLAPPLESREQVAALRARLERSRALVQVGDYEAGLREAEAVHAAAEQLGWLPLRGEASSRISSARSSLGDYEGAQRSVQEAVDDALAGDHDVLLLDVATRAAVLGWRRGELETAELWASLATGLIARLDLEGSLRDATQRETLGLVVHQRGDYEAALVLLREALAITEQQLGPSHFLVGNLLGEIGTTLGALDRKREGLDSHQRALAIALTTFGDAHPNVATSLNNIGGIQSDLGEYELARASYQQAHDILVAAFGPEHVSVGYTLINLGTAEKYLGRLDRSLELLERGLINVEAALGAKHPTVAATINNIGSTHADLGHTKEAREYYQRSVELLEATFGLEHPDLAAPLTNVGNMRLREGDPAGALEDFERALGIRERALGPDHVALAYSLTGRGRALLELDRVDEASLALERALALREAAGVEGELLAVTQFALAQVRWAQDRREDARELAANSLANYRQLEAHANHRATIVEIEAWLAAH